MFKFCRRKRKEQKIVKESSAGWKATAISQWAAAFAGNWHCLQCSSQKATHCRRFSVRLQHANNTVLYDSRQQTEMDRPNETVPDWERVPKSKLKGNGSSTTARQPARRKVNEWMNEWIGKREFGKERKRAQWRSRCAHFAAASTSTVANRPSGSAERVFLSSSSSLFFLLGIYLH